MKKGVAIALNTIIIAIIGLTVLFVVIFMVFGAAKKPGELYKNCGEGIYSGYSCMKPSGPNPLCIKTQACPSSDGGEERCCPNEAG